MFQLCSFHVDCHRSSAAPSRFYNHLFKLLHEITVGCGTQGEEEIVCRVELAKEEYLRSPLETLTLGTSQSHRVSWSGTESSSRRSLQKLCCWLLLLWLYSRRLVLRCCRSAGENSEHRASRLTRCGAEKTRGRREGHLPALSLSLKGDKPETISERVWLLLPFLEFVQVSLLALLDLELNREGGPKM